MSLKIKIAARLKAKAAGVNLSQKRIEAIVARAEKGLTDESDDAAIDANLDTINDLTPFKEIASFDDHERAKAKKIADDKEAARLKAIEEGKPAPIEVDPNESNVEKMLRLIMEKQEKQDAVIAGFNKEKVTTTRREQYAKALEGTSDTFKAKALKDFDRMAFKDDEDFTSYLADATEDAKGFVQEAANGGLGGDRPTGGAGGNDKKVKVATKEEIDAIMQSI
ncbi:hypothetical protein A0256_23170 [Mucilaginibacter sp. PAMC 26640]|nr:hypothetical protein A0256_23170 [Mucilaginibacter sp. PAMC 26640]